MDVDHLLALVTASRDECEALNDTGPEYEKLEAYLVDIVSVRKPLIGAVRKEAFVQGYMRGRFGELHDKGDEELLAVLPEADKAFVTYRKERT